MHSSLGAREYGEREREREREREKEGEESATSKRT
jgi:hypothetical protein